MHLVVWTKFALEEEEEEKEEEKENGGLVGNDEKNTGGGGAGPKGDLAPGARRVIDAFVQRTFLGAESLPAENVWTFVIIYFIFL